MEVKIAKSAGFCFGVSNALKIVYELINQGKCVNTIGEITHNNQVINELEKRGVKAIHSFLESSEEVTLVIRSHGIPKEALKDIKNSKREFVDATCPFVKKIHRIVEKDSQDKRFLLIAGDSMHPEVVGIKSYFNGEVYTFSNLKELKHIIYSKINFFSFYKGVAVSQTTFSIEKWNECVEFLSKSFTNIKIYDTICNITSLRQQEAKKLSKISDLMIVIGGKQSSNTKKLFEICSNYTKTIWIENLEELLNYDLKKYKNITVTSGASTPKEKVIQVKNYLQFI